MHGRVGMVLGLISLCGGLAWNAFAAEQTRNVFTGKITALTSDEPSITVQGIDGSRRFGIDSDTVISTTADSDADLDDLQVGDQVNVSYTDDDGILTARRVERSIPSATPP